MHRSNALTCFPCWYYHIKIKMQKQLSGCIVSQLCEQERTVQSSGLFHIDCFRKHRRKEEQSLLYQLLKSAVKDLQSSWFWLGIFLRCII